MKTIFTLFLIFFSFILFAQGDNCSDPKVISLTCPVTKLTGETTSGFNNDYTGMSGNDVVYRIDVPAGVQKVLISVTGLSNPFNLMWKGTNCNASYPPTYSVQSLKNNLSFNVSGPASYYFTIDHSNASDITYDLAFGYVGTLSHWVNIPDTRGNWRFSQNYCQVPSTKPNLEVTYNSAHQDIPITFAPLGSSGVLCTKIFLENQTGMQGVREVTFDFGSSYTNISPAISSMPGFYNSGTWKAAGTGNFYTWYFKDAAGMAYGDFTGSPKTCLAYQFCFNMTPVNNSPFTSNIVITAYPDFRGKGYTGTLFEDCCPISAICSDGATAGGGGIAVGVNDPPLPVHFVSVKLSPGPHYNDIQWQTAYEKNVSHFEIEKSLDNHTYQYNGRVKATGNSGMTQNYSFRDIQSPLQNVYYRIRSVDFDGSGEYSSIVYSEDRNLKDLTVTPNPASAVVNVASSFPIETIKVTDATGKVWLVLPGNRELRQEVNISLLPSGFYYLTVSTVHESKVVKILHE